MRRFCKRALAVLTAAAMLSAGSSALAAEGDAGISVQLDGQTLMVKEVEVYPTHVRVNVEGAADNTA